MKRSSRSRKISGVNKVVDLIRERGPMTVAAFMDLALYDPEFGYYARASRRSGRAGDFFTSVDVSPLFGELLEIQLAEMHHLLARDSGALGSDRGPGGGFDLVEAGAGDGRLSADILAAARRRDPAFYDSIRLHLVEISARARGAQRETLGDAADRLLTSFATLSAGEEAFEGAIIANELLDALPVHQVVMRSDGLREIYVTAATTSPGIRTVEGPPSSGRLAEYLDRAAVTLETGWRAEINLRAVDWIRGAARRLRRGFFILIDYGHEARELYSITHASGTLTAFTAHRSRGPEYEPAAWLLHPGEQDITAHVDFTSIRKAAEGEGLKTLAYLDQTYFLLGLAAGLAPAQLRALKTLVMPGGLGSAHKVLLLGKHVGTPMLAGCSFKVRAT